MEDQYNSEKKNSKTKCFFSNFILNNTKLQENNLAKKTLMQHTKHCLGLSSSKK